MNTTSAPIEAPSKRLLLRFLLLVPLAIAMVLASRAYIGSVCSTYTAWTPPSAAGEDYRAYDIDDLAYSTPGIVEALSVEQGRGGSTCVTFRSLQDGETEVTFGDARLSTHWTIRVQNGAIIADGVNFSGWESVHLCICLYLGVLAALFASALIHLAKRSWYGYEMVICGGGFLFSFVQCALFAFLALRGSLRNFSDLAYQITAMVDYFVMLTLLPMALLALLVSVSNISLIRHEGRRPTNLLGIAISIAWLGAILFWYEWQLLGIGRHLPHVVLRMLDTCIAVAITYGECLLLSTIACAWLASRHVPRHAADYLVVLGCGIRKDGTPTPLLAGRIDKARTFDEARVAAGDKPATFVPSGGQGPDEIISEAQCMADYLVRQGVDASRIVLENRSTTTSENMAFSRAIIEQHAGCDVSNVSVAFSTTNYHVFRGYVCAHQAGMAVEGLGSKTKYYFWPNAFLREFAGLLVAQWRAIIQTYLILAVIYSFAEYVLLLG